MTGLIPVRSAKPFVTSRLICPMPWIINFLFFLVAVFYVPLLFFKGRWRSAVLSRLRPVPEDIKKFCSENKIIWIHAVSVGEVQAVIRFVGLLKVRFPGYKVVLTTVTGTGYQLALSKVGAESPVLYAPLDFSWVVQNYIQAFQPRVYITTETEIWPNLFLALTRRQVPVILFNGRISARSFSRYRRVKFFLRLILKKVSLCCMQTEKDALRIRALGVPRERIHVLGSVKFDDASAKQGYDRAEYGYAEDDFILVAGSTHPGEEGVLLSTFQRLQKEFPRLHLILAPRHIERTSEVMALIENSGYVAVPWTRIKTVPMQPQVVVAVDTIGHLQKLYSLATIVFVGKSLLGKGGQNIIEPAVFGKPILVGPYTENFQRIVEIFKDQKAVIQVDHPRSLEQNMRALLSDKALRNELGRNAKNVIRNHQGATENSLNLISPFL